MLVLRPIHAHTCGSRTKLQSFKMFVTYFTASMHHTELDLRNTNFDRLAFHVAYDFASLSSPPSVSRKPTILHHYLGKDWQSLHLGTGALGKGSP